MILLFASLCLHIVDAEMIRPAARFLLGAMALFFICLLYTSCFHDPDSVFTYDGCVASGVFPERDDWTSGRIFISDQPSAVFPDFFAV